MNNAVTPATSPARMDSTGNPGIGEGTGVNVKVVDVSVTVVAPVIVCVVVTCVETVDVVTVVVAVTDWVVVEVVVTGIIIVVVVVAAALGPNCVISPFSPTAQPSVEPTIQTSRNSFGTTGTENTGAQV